MPATAPDDTEARQTPVDQAPTPSGQKPAAALEFPNAKTAPSASTAPGEKYSRPASRAPPVRGQRLAARVSRSGTMPSCRAFRDRPIGRRYFSAVPSATATNPPGVPDGARLVAPSPSKPAYTSVSPPTGALRRAFVCKQPSNIYALSTPVDSVTLSLPRMSRESRYGRVTCRRLKKLGVAVRWIGSLRSRARNRRRCYAPSWGR